MLMVGKRGMWYLGNRLDSADGYRYYSLQISGERMNSDDKRVVASTGEGDGEQRAGDKRGEEIKQEPRRSMGRNAVRAFVVRALSHNRMVLVLVSNQSQPAIHATDGASERFRCGLTDWHERGDTFVAAVRRSSRRAGSPEKASFRANSLGGAM